MTPIALLVLAAASYRTWRLLVHDTILENLRARILFPIGDDDQPHEREGLLEFIECPWCFGFWISTVWAIAYAISPETLWVAYPLAISLGVGLLAKLDAP